MTKRIASNGSSSSPHSGRVPHRCLVKLKGIYNSLKKAERKAADYLLAAPGEIAEAGVVEVARAAGCSEATVVRLAQRLGYEGFPELKAEFALAETPAPYRDVQLSDDPETVVKKVFSNSIQALEDTLGVIDSRQYHEAVEAMLKAKKLAFFGLGNASVVARDMYQEFLRIGVPSYNAEDPDLQLIIVSSQMNKGDVLTAISYSGESRPILTVARQAKARGIKVLAITNFPRSTLGKVADIVLLTAVFQEHMNHEIGAKRLAQLCILESLYVNYLLRQGASARRILEASSHVLGTNKSLNYPTSV